jgi:hypothetical protein
MLVLKQLFSILKMCCSIGTTSFDYNLHADTWGQCYKTIAVNYRGTFNPTFLGLKYHGNLLPFHGNFQGNIALSHRMTVLPWNGGKLPL